MEEGNEGIPALEEVFNSCAPSCRSVFKKAKQMKKK
jgi:hypothetical protein